MSDKEVAIDEVSKSDDYPPEEQGARRAEFLAGIKEAMAQVERGETYTVEEMLKFVEEWARE